VALHIVAVSDSFVLFCFVCLFVSGCVWADATTSAFRFLIRNRSSTDLYVASSKEEGGN
jgi:hypothetical protein